MVRRSLSLSLSLARSTFRSFHTHVVVTYRPTVDTDRNEKCHIGWSVETVGGEKSNANARSNAVERTRSTSGRRSRSFSITIRVRTSACRRIARSRTKTPSTTRTNDTRVRNATARGRQGETIPSNAPGTNSTRSRELVGLRVGGREGGRDGRYLLERRDAHENDVDRQSRDEERPSKTTSTKTVASEERRRHARLMNVLRTYVY